ncbi:MAG: response regulator, partial [Thermodesulfobacteriota bacterium]|nr:response regulator [Thermodesulfobacteriota bacterium]
MKVLVAEDDSGLKSLLEKALEDLGHEVIVANDGQDAWKLLQRNDIRVVITDWIMPEIGGLTLCHKIRNTDFSNYIYIILLTAQDGKEDLINGFESGADDFITKPVELGELKARIQAGERIIKLEERLKTSRAQLLQTEKMASIGQLAAGVAHEINNPTGFVSSNLSTLMDYQKDIYLLISKYRELIRNIKSGLFTEHHSPSILKQVEQIESFEMDV